MLSDAVACLGPGLDTFPHLRILLADLLLALKKRVATYDEWVGDVDGFAVVKGEALHELRGRMAAAHIMHTFSH